MRRVLATAALVWASFSTARPARADVRMSADFLTTLGRAGRRHPLADASGRLPVVLRLGPGMEARDIGALPMGPGLATMRIFPEELPRFEAEHPSIGFSVWPPLRPLLDQSAKWNGTAAYRALLASRGASGGTGRGVVVGIVDTGIDAAHADFRDANGATRIAWLLDMDHVAVGRYPEIEAELGCTDPKQSPCAVLDAEYIDKSLAGEPGYDVPRDASGHGSHVASIAAGNGGPGARFAGGAPEGVLIIAKIAHGADETASDADIARGAQFIFERADAMPGGPLPAVVNLSLGGDFGPHDGTTPLEKTLASLIGSKQPGRAIVVAAGNSGGIYEGDSPEQRLGIHTEARVTLGASARVPLVSPQGHGLPDPLSGKVFIWITFQSGDRVSVGLSGPSGLHIDPVAPGDQRRLTTPDGSLDAYVFNNFVSDESGLNADTNGAVVIWDGKWPAGGEIDLELEGEGHASMWVEGTDDAAISASGEFFAKAERGQTIGVPATHPDLIAVGCTVNRTDFTDSAGKAHEIFDDAGDPADGACYFSAAGPTATGVPKPEISAPGQLVAAAMSQDATPDRLGAQSPFFGPSQCGGDSQCFVVDPAHALLSGTSMSAPQVAGAIALLFERDRSLTQGGVLALLQGGARHPEGRVRFDYQMGAGALDIAGAMQAYEAAAVPLARDPDPAKSWLSLSSSYVRPDPAWSISGLVALRTGEALIADGFDEQRLALRTSQNAAIIRPLSRAGAGLYRFELAGTEDSGGQNVEIDVTFDGRAIGQSDSSSGHRVVPIGPDRWLAFGDVTAKGGCALAAPRRALSFDGSLLGLLIVLRRWAPSRLLTARGPASRHTRAARTAARRDRTVTSNRCLRR